MGQWAQLYALGASLSCSPTDFCAPGAYECTPATSEPDAGGGGGGGADATAGHGGAANGGDAAGGAAGSGADMMGGAAGDAGASGAAGGPALPDDPCLPNAPVDACPLRDDTGIYVDPANGDDRALGTRDAPLASAAKALLIASDLGKPVYLCNAEYDELLDASDAAAALRGGYTCPGDDRGAWVYVAGERASVRPTAAGVVLEVRDVAAFAVSDVDFHAADGEGASASSVAAFVAASTDVAFTRVVLSAGKGVDGADAVLDPFTLPNPESLIGNGSGQQPEFAKECVCPAGDFSRGGGAAPLGGGPGGDGAPDWGGGKGGRLGTCETTGNGGRGEDAPVPAPSTGAKEIGQLLLDGWHPTPGVDGKDGQAGQGGGGAASILANYSASSGGGCGGCGGRGGPGGGGGGASIALLTLESAISLEDVALEASAAGHGGDGAPGQAGQGGGAAGEPPPNYCSGGAGGKGADGTAGGGGAGGISIALLTLASSIDDRNASTTLRVGTAGDGGLGGLPGVNDGINGLSRTKLVLASD